MGSKGCVGRVRGEVGQWVYLVQVAEAGVGFVSVVSVGVGV